jgi:hypothetical protein
MRRGILIVVFGLIAALSLRATAGPESLPQLVEVFPPVIPGDGSSAATVFVRTDSPASKVTLSQIAGTVEFLPLDAQTFLAELTPAQLLDGYAGPGHYLSTVGPIQADDGPKFEFDVEVEDAAIPYVPVVDLAPDIRCAPHAVNVVLNPVDPWEKALGHEKAILSRFYQVLGDDFDFASLVFALPHQVGNRGHFGVKNDVLGVGGPLFDYSAQYGSAGRLTGVTVYPLSTFFDLAETGSLHELAHQWINFLTGPPLLASGSPHWPPSDLARGIMGTNIPPSNEGGFFPFLLMPQGGNTYQVISSLSSKEFVPLDLYLMGLLPPEQVPPFVVVDPADQPIADLATVTGTTLETFLHEVQARQGDGLSRQAAATLRAVTRDGAAYLGLALDGARIPRLPSRG